MSIRKTERGTEMKTIVLRSGNRRRGEIIFQGTEHIVAIVNGREVSLPWKMIREIR